MTIVERTHAKTDVSVSVTSLLITVGLVLVAFKPAQLPTGRSFIYTAIIILCAHSGGLMIMAPITVATADVVAWITVSSVIVLIAFLACRGLVRTAKKDESAAGGSAR